MVRGVENSAVEALADSLRTWSIALSESEVQSASIAVCRSPIELDDADLAVRVVSDLGPQVVIDAVHNGVLWESFAATVAAHVEVGSGAELSADARGQIRALFLSCGFASARELRIVGGATDDAWSELEAAGLVTPSRFDTVGPPRGLWLSLTWSGCAYAYREWQKWAEDDFGKTEIAELERVMDRFVLQLVREFPTPAILTHRRSVLVSIRRSLERKDLIAVADLARAAAPSFAAVGLHRSLLRALSNCSSGFTGSPQRDVVMCALAELWYAEGDLEKAVRIIRAPRGADSSDTSPLWRALEWKTEMAAKIWSERVDTNSVAEKLHVSIVAGMDVATVMDAGLDLASRLLHDRNHRAVEQILGELGGLIAISGNEILIARFEIAHALADARNGDEASARRRLAAARETAGRLGEVAVVHSLSTAISGRPGEVDSTLVGDLLSSLAADPAVAVDEAAVRAALAADRGIPLTRSEGARSPAHAMLVRLVGPVASLDSPESQAGGEDLTARESDVARLVAKGMSNGEIASELGISKWTVVSHLRNIMRKWGCDSRVSVAVLANAAAERHGA